MVLIPKNVVENLKNFFFSFGGRKVRLMATPVNMSVPCLLYYLQLWWYTCTYFCLYFYLFCVHLIKVMRCWCMLRAVIEMYNCWALLFLYPYFKIYYKIICRTQNSILLYVDSVLYMSKSYFLLSFMIFNFPMEYALLSNYIKLA